MTPSTALHYFILFVQCYIISPLTQKWHTRRLSSLRSVGKTVPNAVALVTGPTSGLGKEVAIELGRRGAKVILACRNVEKGQAVAKLVESAQAESGFPQSTQIVELDQCSLSSARECATTVISSNPKLHIIVNNGGIYDIGGCRKMVAGHEQHMMVNHLSHFSLTMRLLPLLCASAGEYEAGCRIVNVSSSIHKFSEIRPGDMFLSKKFSSQLGYANSKCAQILFTRQLRKLEKIPGVHVFAVHPGEVVTGITRSLPSFIQKCYNVTGPLFLLSPQQGARGILYCATSSEAISESARSHGYIGVDCKSSLASPAGQSDKLAAHVWQYSSHAVDLPDSLDLMKHI